MVSEEHKSVANFIKGVHQSLRIKTRKMGASEAWDEHCKERETLQKYATLMHQLATEFWECNSERNDKIANSRVKWVAEHCVKYFMEGRKEIEASKEMKRVKNLFPNEKINCKELYFEHVSSTPLLALDVGSCYNPFGEYSFLNVLPVDLVPASNDVIKTDFLKLDVSGTEPIIDVHDSQSELRSIPRCYFDVVIFSLLLEYMPSPSQRYICCEKAYTVLKEEGLLVIITPDSKHATANASLMKEWRICLAQIGFTRIFYEKLTHIHCMSFRKNCNAIVSQDWAQRTVIQQSLSPNVLKDVKYVSSLLKIPQDFTEYNCDENLSCIDVERNESDNKVIVNYFAELPPEF